MKKGGKGIYHNEMEYLLTSLLSTNIAQGAGLSIVLCYVIITTSQSRINKEPVGQPYTPAARKLLPATKKKILTSPSTMYVRFLTWRNVVRRCAEVVLTYVSLFACNVNPPAHSLQSPHTERSVTVGSGSNWHSDTGHRGAESKSKNPSVRLFHRPLSIAPLQLHLQNVKYLNFQLRSGTCNVSSLVLSEI